MFTFFQLSTLEWRRWKKKNKSKNKCFSTQEPLVFSLEYGSFQVKLREKNSNKLATLKGTL